MIASCSNDQVRVPFRVLAGCVFIGLGLDNQTARISDPLTGELKVELRGHDHTLEVVVFAPIAAYSAIRELAGIPVCLKPWCLLL